MSSSTSSALTPPPPSPSPPPYPPPPPLRRSKRKMGLKPDDDVAPEPKKARKIQHEAAPKKTVPAASAAAAADASLCSAPHARRSKRKMGLEPEFDSLPTPKRIKKESKSKILDEDGGKKGVPGGDVGKKKGKKKTAGRKKKGKKEKKAATKKKEEKEKDEKEEKEKTRDAGSGTGIVEEKAPEKVEKSNDEKAQQWQRILKQGLNASHAARAADSEFQAWKTYEKMAPMEQASTEPPFFDFIQIKSTENLWGNEVFLAIASLWHAAKDPQIGRPMAFVSYNGVTMSRFPNLDNNGCRAPLSAAVGGPEDLLIPIVMDKTFISPPNSAGLEPANDVGTFVNGNGEAQGKDGHIFLVVAHRNEDGSVLLTRMDSHTSSYPQDRIERSAYRVVRKSGWLNMNNLGYAEEMDFDPPCSSELQSCVQQRSLDSCGMHTILNAWVRILGLPPLLGEARSVCPARVESAQFGDEENDFIQQALEVVNLALSGHMDAKTVQAFLNYWGYVRLQDPKAEIVADVGTMRMTEEVLTAVMDEQREVEKVGKKVPETRKWPVKSIGEVKDALGCGRDKALDLLDVAAGDVEFAIDLGT